MKQIIFLLSVISLIYLTGCSDQQEPPTAAQVQVNIHAPGWNVTASPNFHGKALAAKNFNSAECRQCHGSQFDGGIVGVSCKTCHASFPHPATGWVVGANSHGAFLKQNAYKLDSCKGCHGQNYGTVKVNTSCLTCHTMPGGPEACNTCHGNFSGDATDLKNAAPPKGLDDETDATTPAVGAHQAHLPFNPNLSAADACQECHAVPANLAAVDHIDADGKAEVPINGMLVRLKTEGGNRVPNPSYSSATNSCSGTYCHGNWALSKSQSSYNFIYSADKIEGNTASPKWTDSSTAACGTCHGLPPTGHNPFPLSACTNCHGDVVDAFGQINNKAKHVNGKVNVFAQEYPMF
jgi:predicted CxxxxCH...CXXCH cytochrome family protein